VGLSDPLITVDEEGLGEVMLLRSKSMVVIFIFLPSFVFSFFMVGSRTSPPCFSLSEDCDSSDVSFFVLIHETATFVCRLA